MDSLESQESLDSEGRCSRRTQWKILCVVAGVMLLIIIIITTVSVVVTLPLKITFFCRCKLFQWDDCQNLWSSFQQAYVGKDSCNVPMEAYDPLIAAAPFKEECSNRKMFWSKTKDLVQDFTKKRDCFLTLEETVLGSVLDDLTWCGEEGSSSENLLKNSQLFTLGF